ncbi:hypothetical protein HPB51_005473 [Rhipicephalus microplus]|uniref:Inosine/uridine-preferring nucleoside hydrolase domain-containing protein n=1 Tax=Rhipicephalus microplus TaxID=6941 RepID=A0A9J6EXF5_RHIMP|nr:hypothetical protein HPB51_005473 [Rhipicephalus microplus]
MPEKTLIIDTDVGVDDALAILLALANPAKCKVLAITCVAGNVELSKVYTNVLRILNHRKQLQIPVYQGCNRPLVQKTMHCTVFHGQDGLGGASDKWLLPTDDLDTPLEHASVAMVDMVQKHPGALTLVALGPLTNVALAQRLDPTFLSNLKELVIMGGTFEGRGNETPTGEFNFTFDPEAASVVLSEAECKTRIVTYEPCQDHVLDWDWFENWVGGPSTTAQLVRAMTEHPAQRQREVLQRQGFMSCDLITMASVLEPSLVTQSERHPAWVELHWSHNTWNARCRQETPKHHWRQCRRRTIPCRNRSVFTVPQRVIFRSVERVENASDSSFRRMKRVVQPELARKSFVAISSLRETVHACSPYHI